MDGDSQVILLADAMVLIDLGYLGAVGILPQIGRAEVLDVVLEECRHPRQPTLVDDIVASGITVVGSADAWHVKSEEYRAPEISRHAFGLGLRQATELCAWLDILRQRERRVPEDEVKRLKRKMGC